VQLFLFHNLDFVKILDAEILSEKSLTLVDLKLLCWSAFNVMARAKSKINLALWKNTNLVKNLTCILKKQAEPVMMKMTVTKNYV